MLKFGKIKLHKIVNRYIEGLFDPEDKCFLLLTIPELKEKFPRMSDDDITKKHDEIIRDLKIYLKNKYTDSYL